MKTIEFPELQQVFRNAEIWCSGYEKYWFEHAWNVLTRQGMTGYNNSREYYEVWIRAVALARVYHQFCGMVFDENTEPNYTDYIDDEVPMLVVAQLFLGGKLLVGVLMLAEQVAGANGSTMVLQFSATPS